MCRARNGPTASPSLAAPCRGVSHAALVGTDAGLAMECVSFEHWSGGVSYLLLQTVSRALSFSSVILRPIVETKGLGGTRYA